MTNPYREQIQLAFRYCDPAGIMFFANVFDLAHDGLERFIVSREIAWSEWFNNPEVGAPIRHTECEYLQPLIGGEFYDLTVEPLSHTTSSLTLQFSFTKNETLYARVKLVVVFINKHSIEKISIPADILSKLIS